MRPIRLELSAFGPYLEHTVIDFEKLNEAGLFLITGQTGGGKTTLLDAMSIALFYKSTGGRRTFQDMRCLAAADSDRTEVVYHFALGEDEYCFRRALYRRKKRGSDDFITEEENECKRRTADGWALAASGAARNVTGYAENLLSLTAEQFSQVIVLPQGKFMQLLRANSTEKAAILKTLFSCELWERIAMKFTERQKKLYAKRETCETKLKSLLEKHGAETAEALAVQTEALRSECARTEKALAAAKEALTLAQKQYTRALQFEQCQKAETDAEAQLKTAEARAASAKAQYTRAEQNRAGLTKLTAEKDTLLKRSEQLRAEQERSLQKEQLLKELRAEEERERAVQKQAEDDRQKLPEVLRRIAVGEAFTEKADAAKDRLASLLQTQTILSEQLAALKTRSDAAKAEAQCKKLWEAAEDAARTARLTVVGQDKLLSAAEAKWNQNSAAALATGLTDGTPCPVCGAVHHPVLAVPCAGETTKEELDALRKKLEDLRQEQSRAEQTAAAAKARHEVAFAQLNAANDAAKSITESEEVLTAAYIAAQTALNEAQKLAAQAPAAHKKLETLKAEREALMQVESRHNAALAACRAALEEKRRQLSAMDAVRDAAQITLEMTEIQKRIRVLEQETAALEEAFHAAENALSAANEAVKAAAQQMFAAKEAKNALGAAPEKNLPQSKAELDAKSTETQTLSVQLGRFGSDLRTITESAAAVQQYTEEAAALDVQYSRAAKLAGYVTGRSNALRVPLLQYVLGMMLDETIQSANRFFSVLSRGRYALQHKQGKSGAGYGGLDIEVLDGMSGTCRSVETLSGGEQFLASLSLAFGLSDVVQSYSGAVRLDSIFIDEGFGSLDTDTLDTAMRALESIRQSGRVVGIISHVSELQSRIPTMIRIWKTASGSAAAKVIAED